MRDTESIYLHPFQCFFLTRNTNLWVSIMRSRVVPAGGGQQMEKGGVMVGASVTRLVGRPAR